MKKKRKEKGRKEYLERMVEIFRKDTNVDDIVDEIIIEVKSCTKVKRRKKNLKEGRHKITMKKKA